MFPSRFMPCPSCGDSVERHDSEQHQCDPGRLVEYQMFFLREQIYDFERDFRAFADTGAGRFETWVAARTVQKGRA